MVTTTPPIICVQQSVGTVGNEDFLPRYVKLKCIWEIILCEA